MTIRQIVKLVGISSGEVYTVLKEHLKLKKLSARWIPTVLTEEQKQERVRISDTDETLIHYFKPQRKIDNKVWLTNRAKRQGIAERYQSAKTVVYAFFFNNCSGPVAQIPIRKGRSITGRDYKDQVMKQI